MILKYRDPRFYSVDSLKCWKNVNVPLNVVHPDATIDIRSNSLKEILLPLSAIDPNFKLWLAELGLEISLVRLFIASANYEYTKHVDRQTFNDQSVALNFAFDDTGTVFSWHNLNKDGRIEVTKNKNNIPIWNFSNCATVLAEEIKHRENQPFLVNTGYIHSLKVGNQDRHCYSYFLRKAGTAVPLQWDDAIIAFDRFI